MSDKQSAKEFYEARAGVRRACQAQFIAKDVLCMTLWEAFEFAEKYAAAASPQVTPSPAKRSDKDYAIEHAEYLAKAVEHYQATKNAFAEFMESADRDRDEEMIDQFRSDLSESWRGMNFCIFEFRKRAKRAEVTSGQASQVTPELSLEKLKEIVETPIEDEWDTSGQAEAPTPANDKEVSRG